MRYGIEVVPFGDLSDPRPVVRLAQAAEAAGWEALWIWDHVVFPYGAGDPWVTLAAVAGATKRLKLVTGVAPLPRYRPHLLARTLTALDILSEGRVIFGTGLGVAFDFAPFGEPTDDRTRAAMADEGLDLLARYWSGEPVTHRGAHYAAHGAQLVPTPAQRPRIPVWVGGESRSALRRAARWDGWIMGAIDEGCKVIHPPEWFVERIAFIRGQRAAGAAFDVAVDGATEPGDTALARAYEQAGATWWFEAIFGSRASLEELLRRVEAGPPR